MSCTLTVNGKWVSFNSTTIGHTSSASSSPVTANTSSRRRRNTRDLLNVVTVATNMQPQSPGNIAGPECDTPARL